MNERAGVVLPPREVYHPGRSGVNSPGRHRGPSTCPRLLRATGEGSPRFGLKPCHGPALVQNGFEAPEWVHESGGEGDPYTIEHLQGQQLEVLGQRRLDPEMLTGEAWTNGQELPVARLT